MIRMPTVLCLLFLFNGCQQQPSSSTAHETATKEVDLAEKAPSSMAQRQSSPVGIQVLGTAQDAGYPQIGCEKDCCKAHWTGRREKETPTCLGLIDRNNQQMWLFEATPDIIEQWQHLQEACPSCEMAGILITHAHMGHYTGLMQLGREAMGAQGIAVYAMPKMREYLSTNGPWSQLVALGNIVLKPLEVHTETVLSSEVSVQPFLVPHRDEFSETVGFSIHGPNQSALFIPDIDKWSKWDEKIEDKVLAHHYSFLDGTFYDSAELPGRNMSEIPHPFILESLSTFADLDAAAKKTVHFIHFNHTNPLLNEASEPTESVLKAGFSLARSHAFYPL